MKKSISEKELGFIADMELKEKYYFTREDIRKNFTSDNEMNVYIHRLKKKGRIIKLNKNKYYLVPVKAGYTSWSVHPYVIIDEIMDGKGYCIVGKAAAYYWKLIDQIPFEYEVYNIKKHETIEIFNARIKFRKRRQKNIPKGVAQTMHEHPFIIATKVESSKWS